MSSIPESTGPLSAVEALAAAQAAIDDCDDPAIVISRPDRDALAHLAHDLDARPGDEVPLRGTTFTIKDNIDLAGTETTVACPPIAYAPSRSAAVVEALMQAGAIPVAKVNLDQFATGLVGTRSPFGIPLNPYDARLAPGGSSSGSAASVAAGLARFSIGTDTAGSGRVPAALCGIASIKPTPGRASNSGIVPAVRSIDCPAFFARSVTEAWRATKVASGFDETDPFSRRSPGVAGRPVGRVGVIAPADLAGFDVEARLATEHRGVQDELTGLGIELVEIDPAPLFGIGDELYEGPVIIERALAVAGLEPPAESVDRAVGAVLAGASSYTADDVHRARYRIELLRHRVDMLFDEVDALVLPTVGSLPTIAQIAASPLAVNAAMGRFTTFANLAGMCSATVPFPTVSSGIDVPPPSATFYGPAWSDEHIVAAAARLAGERPLPPPDDWVTLAVAGAHLRGEALDAQLTDRGAIWVGTTATSAAYRLYAMPSTPPKPALVHDGTNGASIEVDLWSVSPAALGSFVTMIPAPLGIGKVELEDGTVVTGFIAEPRALDEAIEITAHGGWRGYRAHTGGTAT